MKIKDVFLLVLLVCIFPISVLLNCSSSDIFKNKCLKLEGLDTSSYTIHNLFEFTCANGEKLFFITKKEKIPFDYTKYDTLKSGNKYCFDFTKINEVIQDEYLTLSGKNEVYIDEIPIWSNGKFIVKLYKSETLNGIYIKK